MINLLHSSGYRTNIHSLKLKQNEIFNVSDMADLLATGPQDFAKVFRISVHSLLSAVVARGLRRFLAAEKLCQTIS